jgi:hypothetical protein
LTVTEAGRTVPSGLHHLSFQRRASGMGETHFDQLTRGLALTGTRRRTVLALALAALRALTRQERAAAALAAGMSVAPAGAAGSAAPITAGGRRGRRPAAGMMARGASRGRDRPRAAVPTCVAGPGAGCRGSAIRRPGMPPIAPVTGVARPARKTSTVSDRVLAKVRPASSAAPVLMGEAAPARILSSQAPGGEAAGDP